MAAGNSSNLSEAQSEVVALVYNLEGQIAERVPFLTIAEIEDCERIVRNVADHLAVILRRVKYPAHQLNGMPCVDCP